jgi:hypothetical protein
MTNCPGAADSLLRPCLTADAVFTAAAAAAAAAFTERRARRREHLWGFNTCEHIKPQYIREIESACFSCTAVKPRCHRTLIMSVRIVCDEVTCCRHQHLLASYVLLHPPASLLLPLLSSFAPPYYASASHISHRTYHMNQ